MGETAALTERILFLRAFPQFRDIPSGEVAAIARGLRPHSYAKGDVILREEDPPQSLHLITSGHVGVWRKGHRFGELRAPNAVGFVPLVARMNDQFGITAEGPTTTLEADSDSVFELLEEQFDLVINAMRANARMLLLELKRKPTNLLQRMTGHPPSPQDMPIPDRPLDVVERIFFLRRLPPFRAGSIDSLAVVSRSFEEVRFAPGETIWREGDPSGSMLLVVRGSMRSVPAAHLEPATFRSGAVVGGFESMAGEPRWYDLVADTPVTVLRNRTEALLEVFEDNHDMARGFLAMSTTALMSVWDERIENGDPPTTALEALAPRRA